MEILSGASLHPQCMFLIQFLFKIDGNPLWSLPPPPVHVSYSILIQNWWKSSLAPLSSPSACFLFNPYSKLMEILSGASLILQCMFLMQFLNKTDGNPFWSLPPPPVHIPYSILIQNWWKKYIPRQRKRATPQGKPPGLVTDTTNSRANHHAWSYIYKWCMAAAMAADGHGGSHGVCHLNAPRGRAL